MDIKPIVDFVVKNSPHKDKKLIKEVIKKHIEYKTCVILFDKDNKVVAVVRWNLSPSMRIAYIEDLIIRKDFRNKRIIKLLLLKGLRMFPMVKFLSWERNWKYPNREAKLFSVDRILKKG